MAKKVQYEIELLDQISSQYKRSAQSMSSSDKKIISSLKKVEKQTKKADIASKGLISGIAGLAAAFGGLLVIRKVNSVISDSIRLFGIQAEAEADLEQTLKSTGHAAGITSDELKKMASGLQNVTKFGDETILRGQAMLLTFKNIGKDTFPAATESMLNLATKMKTDVKEAAIQLGKALNDPITGLTALRRVGITFSESQENTIKTMQKVGDIAGAQKIILAELESQFGGVARAVAKVGTGPLEQFQNRIGDIKEDIGQKMLPVVLDLAKGFERWLKPERVDRMVNAFDDWAQGMKQIYGLGVKFFGLFDKGEKATIDLKAKVTELKNISAEVEKMQSEKYSIKGILNLGKLTSKLDEQLKIRQEIEAQGVRISSTDQTYLNNMIKGLKTVNAELDKKTEKEKPKTKPKGEGELDIRPIFGPEDPGAGKLNANLQRRNELLQANIQKELDLKEAARKKDLEAAETNRIRLKKIAEDEWTFKKNLALQEQALRKQGAGDFVNNLQTIAQANKKFGGVYKASAMAQNMIDTYAGATAAFKSLAGIPIVGPGLGIAAAAAAVGAGVARHNMISAQKFARGGVVEGRGFPSTGDNVPAMLNPGEVIFNKRQFKDLTSGRMGNTIHFEAPIINVSGSADIGSIKDAVTETYEEAIAKTAELLNETHLQEVIA